jgi:hypothetical protein
MRAHALQVEHAKQFINEKFVPRLRGAAHKVLLCCAPHHTCLTIWLLPTCRHCRRIQAGCHRRCNVQPDIAMRRQPHVHAQVEIVHFQTDAESVGEVLCARAKDLNAVALVMARQVHAGLDYKLHVHMSGRVLRT